MAEMRGEQFRFTRVLSSRTLRWGFGIPAAVAAVLFFASFVLDEPLRGITEAKLNRDLKGYSVRLPALHVQLLDLSVSLKEMTVVQQAHPDPPVASFPRLKASIHWSGLLAGKLVAEFRLDKPKININLLQLRSEVDNTVPLKERGWQQAVEDIYPLKINSLKINDANISYIGDDQKRPLILSNFNLHAKNIRNVNLPDKIYPSSFHLDTAIFGTGQGRIDGAANFLAKPLPGIKGRIMLEKVPVDYFNTAIPDSNFSIHGGLLSASGDAEFAPTVKIAHLEKLEIQGMTIDYTHSLRTAAVEKKRVVAAGKKARELTNRPGILLTADQVNLTGCTIGMVNKAARNPYRIYLSDTDLHAKNFSNQSARGTAQVKLAGKFMGSGMTTATADIRPKKAGSDLDLYLKIDESQLTAMNNVLLSYGDFDVSAGVFSLVTELHITDGAISGYIKPFFKDMDVYDRRKDMARGVSHQMYEMLIGGVATLLENRSHQEVATRVDIKGAVGNPETSTLQIVVELVRNAFFKAMLPSFEKR
ncbi:MAG: DUF748 domain-containing protein [Desulfuromonadaceae bacterium]|nr:DUF748 domain-containing protein [Desulfuromonadaceae bacterium]MDD5105464.1 DUF748 domain-containing protein [Desulfuromonadaceae bacterium]